MNRQQILDLYDWRPGICFRHPGRGEVPTTVIGVIHPREEAARDVRACEDCVINLEDIKREDAARRGSGYEPGHLGEVLS